MPYPPAAAQVAPDVYEVVTGCGDDVDVRALVLFGEQFTLLIDTLQREEDLDAARPFVQERGRPLLIVNSHADWDHWWGNAAFPDAPVIAHRLTSSRQLREGKRTLANKRRGDPDTFGSVSLRPATIAFDGELDLDLGGLHAELRLLPGHTHDCIVAFVPELRLLFAGDTAEDPIPLLNEGVIGEWPAHLRAWAERTEIVVPAHGAVQGPELLLRNAAYLEGLTASPEREIAELDGALPFYRRAHRENVRKAGSL